MLDPKCFLRPWLDEQRAHIQSQNPVILEKAIVALQLLGYLAESGLPFQFVGGTSLLLRLNPIRRLSIDIDIVTQASSSDLEPILEGISKLSPFTSYEHDARRDKVLPPKKHFRFIYPSAIEPKADHVLLDVLFEPNAVKHSEPVVITTPFISPKREVRVSVPTVEGLLGDKLTAFAPKTIGILSSPERNTDIAKQLFDVGALFDSAKDLNAVSDAYAAAHARQLRYRGASYSLADTLNDTISAGFEYSQLGLRGAKETDTGLLLQGGIKSLQGHLINQPFHQDQARVAAGKAALASAWIQKKPNQSIDELRYKAEKVADLRTLIVSEPWQPLNRLKGANPEAFHYWHQAQRILNGS